MRMYQALLASLTLISGAALAAGPASKPVEVPAASPYQHVYAAPASEGLQAVNVGGKIGFVDSTGRQVIRSEFDLVEAGNLNANRFAGGLAAVKTSAGWGLIDKAGKLVHMGYKSIEIVIAEAPMFKDAEIGNRYWLATTEERMTGGGKRSQVDAIPVNGGPSFTLIRGAEMRLAKRGS